MMWSIIECHNREGCGSIESATNPRTFNKLITVVEALPPIPEVCILYLGLQELCNHIILYGHTPTYFYYSTAQFQETFNVVMQHI